MIGAWRENYVFLNGQSKWTTGPLSSSTRIFLYGQTMEEFLHGLTHNTLWGIKLVDIARCTKRKYKATPYMGNKL